MAVMRKILQPSRGRPPAAPRLLVAALAAAGCLAAQAGAADITVLGTTVVSETRVGRTTFDYEMRLNVRNDGPALDALSMRVASANAMTTTVINAVSFAPIAAGATATSADTFTIRHDRTAPFDPGALTWVEMPAPPGPLVSRPVSPTKAASALLAGRAAPNAAVEVSGGLSLVATTADANGAFSTSVSLLANRVNRLFAVAIDAAGRRSAPTPVEILHDSQAPTLFIDFPADNATLTNESIVVAGRVGDMLSGFMGLGVTVNGQPANVIVGIGQNGTFERGGVPLSLGANTITATATDVNGNSVSKQVTVTRVPLSGPQMAAVSGDGQKAGIYSRVSQPIVVKVTESDGLTPIVNKLVTFTVTRSDGRLSKSSTVSGTPGASMLQVATDASGLARAYWTMGGDAGCGNNRVRVTSRDIAGTVNFCASADPAPPSQINVGSGNNQRAETGAPAPLALRAWVNDSCNGVAGIPVLFSVVGGGGKVNGQDMVVVDTSITGHAEVVFTLGPQPGNNRVRADFPGNPGAPATFLATGLARQEATPTSFSGLVLNNANQPIGGATCTLQIAGNVSRNTTTDAQGRFTFSDTAPGTGYLHVNGLSATSEGGAPIPTGSFPALSYTIVVVANAANALPTPVLLPKLNPANAKTYDGTRDVVLTCEGIDGLRMTIKAGSMRRFDGSLPSPASPEIVTLNQVHHDDIPMPMPDGAAPPFAWTLQPAGATFDPPITIEYPNMSGLPAGAIAYFLSFNHATERFEIVASGHVTADGSTIVTDPGVGLNLAGWGCNCPPYSVTTDCENCLVFFSELGDKFGYDDFTNPVVPWKSVAVGDNDTVKGSIRQPDDPTRVDFFTTNSAVATVAPTRASSSSQTFTITGSGAGTALVFGQFRDVYCGGIQVAAYPRLTKTVAVTLVHEMSSTPGDPGYTSTDISDAAITAMLQHIYKQAVVEWTVVRRPAVTVEFDLNNDGKIDVDNWMSAEMAAIRDAAGSGHEYNVFLVDKPSDGSSGFMEFNQKYGYIHADNGNARTVAHELGHGQGLKHRPNDGANVMWNYTSDTKEKLRKDQWDKLH